MRRFAAVLAASGILWLAGCGKSDSASSAPAAKSATAKGGNTKGGEQARNPALDSIPVHTAAVVRGPISAFLSFNSTLETEATVDLFPQIGGQVEVLNAEEGDVVKGGDVLLKIDDRELRVDLEESAINLRHLEESFSRVEELFKRQLMNQQEFDDKRFQLDQARLRHDRAKLRLDHATIRAPFDGVVSARDVQVGARVSSGTKLFSMVKLDEIVARVFVPGRYLAAVSDGQAAAVTSEFLPGRRFTGWVKRISPVIDPKSGTFRVTVGVKGENGELAPGLFVNVQIVTDTREEALLIPKTAVVYEGGERYVYAVADGKAQKRRLEVGFENVNTVEVLSGFEPGEPVIVLGQNALKDGTTVRVVEARGATDTLEAPVARRAATPAPGT